VLNNFVGLLTLFGVEVGLQNLILIHEEVGQDLIHIDSTDVVVLVVVDHVDKVHRLLVEPEETQPFLEVHMLIFHLFY